MLYVFLGFPGQQLPPGERLHAGGLQHCIEMVEELGLLDHDPAIQARKEGLFVLSPSGASEQIADLKIHLSDRVVQIGITDNWFNDNASFGNGVACLKSTAHYQTKVVNHECGRTLEQLLRTGGVIDLSKLRLQQVHDFTEGWGKYEYRWRAGTCPQVTHIVHLTAMLTKRKLKAFAYQRILDLVENGAEPKYLDQYSTEPGKHFSAVRKWQGESQAPSKEMTRLLGG
jgi:hypothetical protein